MSLTLLTFSLDEKITLPAVPVKFLRCIWLDDCETSSDIESSGTPLLSITSVDSAVVKKATLLTNGNDVKHKIEIFLNTEKFECSYLPGDTIGMFPVNPTSEVEELIELLDMKEKASKKFRIDILSETTKKNPSVPKHLPKITTLRDLLSKHLEIRTPVKKLLLRSLCNHTENEKERRRLEELCSKEGAQDYTQIVLSSNVSLLTVLKSFRTCKPPISLLLEHLPAIKPRVYSVASSPLIHGKLLRIVVTLVENESGSKGVCSGYLNDFISKSTSLEETLDNLTINDEGDSTHLKNKVSIFFRQPNSFRYPENPSLNLIFIGPGSGVAPFIGFLEHKKALMSVESNQTWLFFGCRNEDDYLYRDELKEFLSSGILTKLFVSFSRASLGTNSPKYVQDNIVSIKEEFIELLTNSETCMFICGDAHNMVKDVLLTVKSCLQQVKGMNESEADNKIKELTKSGIIVTDSWI